MADRTVDAQARVHVCANERLGINELAAKNLYAELDLRHDVNGNVATHIDIIAGFHVEALALARWLDGRADVVRRLAYHALLVSTAMIK